MFSFAKITNFTRSDDNTRVQLQLCVNFTFYKFCVETAREEKLLLLLVFMFVCIQRDVNLIKTGVFDVTCVQN